MTRLRLSAVLLGIAITSIGFWGAGGSHSEMTALSPDNTYRLELMSLSRIGAVLHSAESLPGYAELYNNINGRSVARGPEQNFLGNADIHWDMKTSGVITVGTTIFWHIAPLASDGHKLPIEDEMNPHRDN